MPRVPAVARIVPNVIVPNVIVPQVIAPHVVFLAAIALALLVGTSGAQAQSTLYSFVLRNTPFANNPEFNGSLDPNTIFGYDPSLGVAVPVSTRLADAINAQMPGALVDALSYGRGAFCLIVPHGDLHFGISREPVDGGTAGIPGTDLAWEPRADAESDMFWVENVPADADPDFRGTHAKTIEENSQPSVRSRFPYFPEPVLGVHGLTGQPNGLQRELTNVAGFDYHPANYADRDIYFSIEAPVAGFHPADILRLDPGGMISVHRTYLELGLGVADNVDALCLDLFHSATVNQDPHAIFSLTRDSSGVASPNSAADIFMTNLVVPGAYWIYRFAAANGVDPSEGDIDCIVSIDPLQHWHERPEFLTESSLGIDGLSRLTSRSVRVDDETIARLAGVEPLVPLDDPFQMGDRRSVRVWGEKKGRTGIVGQAVIEIESPTAPVTDLFGVSSGDSIDWFWSPPPAVDSYMVSMDNQPSLAIAVPLTPAGSPLTTSVDLAPGVHMICVQAVSGGVASLPVCATVEIPPGSTQAPGSLGVVRIGPREVELTYELEGDLAEIDVRLDGAPQGLIAGGAAGTDGVLAFSDLDFGYHRIELQGTTPEPTHVSAVEFYLPRPPRGSVVATGVFPGPDATGVTLIPDESLLLIADRATGLTYRFDSATLALIDTIPSPNLIASSEIVGVAYDGTGPGSPQLFWIAVAPGGTTQLMRTETDGTAPTLVASVVTPFGGSDLGDLCLDPASDLLFVAVPDQGVYFPITRDGQNAPGTAALAHPRGVAAGRGIACRPDGRFIVPAGATIATDLTDLVTITPTSAVRTTAPVGLDILGELGGMAYTRTGSQNIPSIYTVDDTGSIYEIAANGALPAADDCHLAIFGGDGVRQTDSTPILDATTTAAVTETTLEVSDPRIILDLDATIAVTHEQPSDLTIELESPQGTIVTLQSQVLPYQTELVVRYDDLYMPGFNDEYGDRAPFGQLADFDGEPLAGTWTLRVFDHYPGRTGTIESFGLRYCATDVVPVAYVTGDANTDGQVDIGDGIFILNRIFAGGPDASCAQTLDVNGDQMANIGDAISLFSFIFSGGPAPVAPYPQCGFATVDPVDCAAYDACP